MKIWPITILKLLFKQFILCTSCVIIINCSVYIFWIFPYKRFSLIRFILIIRASIVRIWLIWLVIKSFFIVRFIVRSSKSRSEVFISWTSKTSSSSERWSISRKVRVLATFRSFVVISFRVHIFLISLLFGLIS